MATKKDTDARRDGLKVVYTAIHAREFAELRRLEKTLDRSRAAVVRILIGEALTARRGVQTEAAR